MAYNHLSVASCRDFWDWEKGKLPNYEGLLASGISRRFIKLSLSKQNANLGAGGATCEKLLASVTSTI